MKDDNDCTVIAVSAVTGISYEQSQSLLAKAGRKRNRGLIRQIYHDVIRQLGFTIRQLKLAAKTVRTIEQELAAEWGGCKVLINVKRHVLTWDGERILDNSAGRMYRLSGVYLVYKGAEPEGKAVPLYKQRTLRRRPMRRNGVKVYIADKFIDEYSSLAAAYKANGWSLRGHQKVRRQMKYWGEARVNLYRDNWDLQLITFKLIGKPERE